MRKRGIRVGWTASLLLVFSAARPLQAQDVPQFELPPPDRVLTSDTIAGMTDLRELPDGRTLVADYRGNRLLLIDWLTTTARELGSPIEYRRPLRLVALAGDSTLMTDAITRAWQTLEGTRSVMRMEGPEPLPEAFGGSLYGAVPAGRVLAVRVLPDRPIAAPADTLVAELVDLATSEIDSVTWLIGPARFSTGRAVFTIDGKIGVVLHPLITQEQTLLFRDGWIAVARQDPYRVDWRSPAGAWIHGEPLPSTVVDVDAAERCFQLERVGQGCEFADDLEWPSALPPFVSYRGVGEIPTYTVARLTDVLWPTPEGQLLIRRTPSRSRPGTRYDVIDRGGALIGGIVMDADEAIVGFGKESVYTIATNADGSMPLRYPSQTLRRHRWTPIPPR